MKFNYLTQATIEAFVRAAIAEDWGDGDHSTLGSVPATAQKRARLLIKANGVLAGVEMAQHIFRFVDPSLKMDILLQDGYSIETGQIAFTVEGSARSILSAERVVLNCMQRMSGIATYTRQLVRLVEGTKAKILDTRKTTPNFRLAEKWAVKIGGAENHRFGLFDMVMLKDNHIDFAGGITQAVAQVSSYLASTGKQLRIEVETRNLDEVREALATGKADVIMLDNMSLAMMKEAVQIIQGKSLVEASGGITEKSIRDVALCGVDYISVGALTHSFQSLDMSLKAF